MLARFLQNLYSGPDHVNFDAVFSNLILRVLLHGILVRTHDVVLLSMEDALPLGTHVSMHAATNAGSILQKANIMHWLRLIRFT